MLIWLGALLIPILGFIEAGGWNGSGDRGAVRRRTTRICGRTLGSFNDNPMGIHWTGIVLGLGLVISFGYWTTDFLVVQRVLTAKDLRSAKMAPDHRRRLQDDGPAYCDSAGAAGAGVLPHEVDSARVPPLPGGHSYNEVLPLMLARYFGPGLLGLGITALIAGFMSGMAGNVSAFTTVWTYDIYRPLIRKDASDEHYVKHGPVVHDRGRADSVGTAYLVMQFLSIMDYVQALFSFFIAPLFGTVLLGMLWKRASPPVDSGGLLAGTLSSIGMWAWVKVDPTALSPSLRCRPMPGHGGKHVSGPMVMGGVRHLSP